MPRPLPLPPVQVTDADLAAAYTRHARRSWPPTLQAALADPLYGGLVRMHAITALRKQQALQSAGRPPAVMTSTPRAMRLPALQFDAKRLAAGDRDDD